MTFPFKGARITVKHARIAENVTTASLVEERSVFGTALQIMWPRMMRRTRKYVLKVRDRNIFMHRGKGEEDIYKNPMCFMEEIPAASIQERQ